MKEISLTEAIKAAHEAAELVLVDYTDAKGKRTERTAVITEVHPEHIIVDTDTGKRRLTISGIHSI